VTAIISTYHPASVKKKRWEKQFRGEEGGRGKERGEKVGKAIPWSYKS
jgi:hypothetical protein